jgi:type II secretory pathway pseudopilin PulG
MMRFSQFNFSIGADPMIRNRRSAFGISELLVLLALLSILAAMLFPAILKVRQAANQAKSKSNVRHLIIALANYDTQLTHLPPNLDDKNLSLIVPLLEDLEADVSNPVAKDKSVDDKENLKIAKNTVPVLQSPRDPQLRVTDDFAGTNYLFCAGSKPSIDDNDGVFCRSSKIKSLAQIEAGTSNVMAVAETLKGNGSDKAVSVVRQIVRLGKDALKKLNDDTGVDDFKNNKNISGMRCANWVDGRFLQGLYNATRLPDSDKPDVDCGGEGGLMSIRTPDGNVLLGFFDGRVITLDAKKLKLKLWQDLADQSKGDTGDLQKLLK